MHSQIWQMILPATYNKNKNAVQKIVEISITSIIHAWSLLINVPMVNICNE